MAHIDEVILLRERSFNMLDAARDRFIKGDYDLAIFLLEQAVQLHLKSIILEHTGEIPRTHSIRRLFAIIRSLFPQKAQMIDNFVKNYREYIIILEDAYIASRYLFRRYTHDDIRDIFPFVEKVFEFCKNFSKLPQK